MKQVILDIYHKAGVSLLLKNSDEIIAGMDRENSCDFIQIWFGDMDSPIVSYEKNDKLNKWEFCAWGGCLPYSQQKLDRAIVKSLLLYLKKSSKYRKVKITNIQLALF